MTDGYTADAGRIAARASELADHAQRARRAAETLQSTLDADAQPWGTDVIGQSFAASHTEPAANTLRLLSGLQRDLDEVGGEFAGAARTYTATDAAAAEDADAVGRELGEA